MVLASVCPVRVDFSVPNHPNMVCDSKYIASTLVSALSIMFISQFMKLNSLLKFTFIDFSFY